MKELFNFCMDKGCNMPITEVFENFVGPALEIRWRCKAGHCGDWVSSKMVNRVYVNNIHTAASILFTGNSFCKISLFAKSLQLPFISSSTFLNYQRKYLAPKVHHLWKSVQESMFEVLGNQPVGCERALNALMSKLNIQELVTDASGQIIILLGKCKFIFVF